MKKLFFVGLIGLLLFEILNVYFIMPMPGSQRMNSIGIAYFLYKWRWVFRVLFAVLMLYGLLKARWKYIIVPVIFLLVAGAVIYFANFKMAADRMFYQPSTVAMSNASKAAIDSQQLVIGVAINGAAKAYPIQYLGYHHQVQDAVGSKPVLVTYCTVCRTGRVFDPTVNGKHETFRLVGMDHFNAMPGEFIVLVGPSGCGKTTLLNVLSGYLQPLSGTVTRKGVIRTVYQQDSLFPWLTVAENITMGLRNVADAMQRKKEIQELVELIHLEDFIYHYPHQLSGGMRQRAELARALAGESDILLMDEPFSALDYQTRLRLRNELVRLLAVRQRTIVFVTHDIEEAAQLADRVLILSNRPATICHELSIDAPKPRALTDNNVIEAMKIILHQLGL